MKKSHNLICQINAIFRVIYRFVLPSTMFTWLENKKLMLNTSLASAVRMKSLLYFYLFKQQMLFLKELKQKAKLARTCPKCNPGASKCQKQEVINIASISQLFLLLKERLQVTRKWSISYASNVFIICPKESSEMRAHFDKAPDNTCLQNHRR